MQYLQQSDDQIGHVCEVVQLSFPGHSVFTPTLFGMSTLFFSLLMVLVVQRGKIRKLKGQSCKHTHPCNQDPLESHFISI